MSRAALMRAFARLARAAVGVRIRPMVRTLVLAIALLCAAAATPAVSAKKRFARAGTPHMAETVPQPGRGMNPLSTRRLHKMPRAA